MKLLDWTTSYCFYSYIEIYWFIEEFKTPEGIDVIWLEDKSMETDVAEGKLKTLGGIEVIWLDHKLILTDVALGKVKAPEEIDEILLENKSMFTDGAEG